MTDTTLLRRIHSYGREALQYSILANIVHFLPFHSTSMRSCVPNIFDPGSDICNVTDICNPVSQMYAILCCNPTQCHKFTPCNVTSSSNVTSSRNPVSPIQSMCNACATFCISICHIINICIDHEQEVFNRRLTCRQCYQIYLLSISKIFC